MSDRTRIEWTDATWNPWHGCHHVSPGCDHCYMFTAKRRYAQDPDVVVRSKTTFRDPLKWTNPRKVFTCSWSDFFIKDADPWRDEAWAIVRATPQHTYQVLTKRPHLIARRLPWPAEGPAWPNVWLGVSVELVNFYGRIDELVKVPAAVRFLSLEPLLGPLPGLPLEGIGWVIVGGESGPGWRPMAVEWLEAIRDQCVAADVPLFVKQDAGPLTGRQGRLPEDLWRHKAFPDDPGTLPGAAPRGARVLE